MHEQSEKYRKCLVRLLNAATEKGFLNCVYALLRLDGIALGHFDTTVEIREALGDFSRIRESIDAEKEPKLALRMDLLTYCHAIELSAPYHIIFNLLNCMQGKPYHIRPFTKEIYPHQKIRAIKDICSEIGETELPQIFDEIFDNQIRNSFSHSDYCITEDEFRITDLGITVRKLNEVQSLLDRGITFYSIFFDVLDSFAHSARALMKKYHLNPRHHEVIELLTNEQQGLFGFSIHISNGNKSTFYRLPHEVFGMNIHFEGTGGISLQVGDLSKLCAKYRVNGKEVKDTVQLIAINCRDSNDEVSFKTLKGTFPIDEVQEQPLASHS